MASANRKGSGKTFDFCECFLEKAYNNLRQMVVDSSEYTKYPTLL